MALRARTKNRTNWRLHWNEILLFSLLLSWLLGLQFIAKEDKSFLFQFQNNFPNRRILFLIEIFFKAKTFSLCTFPVSLSFLFFLCWDLQGLKLSILLRGYCSRILLFIEWPCESLAVSFSAFISFSFLIFFPCLFVSFFSSLSFSLQLFNFLEDKGQFSAVIIIN